MSYGIVRVQKFKASGCKGIEIHDRREKELVSHTNPDIDWERTKDNYSLHQGRSAEQTFYQAVKERIDELDLQRGVRKDAVVMSQVLFTSDHNFFAQISQDDQKRYFERCYEWAKEQFGERNIISATVHLDERTPHMHLNFVPVTEDGRLSAKEVLSRERLRDMHDLFYEQVGKEFGLQRGESRDVKQQHLSVMEYKQATAAERMAELARKEQEIQKRIDKAMQKEKALEAKIEGLERKYKGRVLSAKELDAIKPQATLTGTVKGVTMEQIADLKRTAFAYSRARERNAYLEKENKALRVENERLHPKIDIHEQMEINKAKIKKDLRYDLLEKFVARNGLEPQVQETAKELAREAFQLARSISHGPSR